MVQKPEIPRCVFWELAATTVFTPKLASSFLWKEKGNWARVARFDSEMKLWWSLWHYQMKSKQNFRWKAHFKSPVIAAEQLTGEEWLKALNTSCFLWQLHLWKRILGGLRSCPGITGTVKDYMSAGKEQQKGENNWLRHQLPFPVPTPYFFFLQALVTNKVTGWGKRSSTLQHPSEPLVLPICGL